jgi:hypothetical protein
MKIKTLILGLVILIVSFSCTAQKKASTRPMKVQHSEQEIINLSKQKWQWMAEKKADTLAALFHENAMFVHMGGSWGKEQEVNVIKSGGIHYKQADIQEASVKFIGNTAIVLSKIRLLAVVGGNEVTNPFIVTEVYVKEGNKWTLGSLSFTRLMGN